MHFWTESSRQGTGTTAVCNGARSCAARRTRRTGAVLLIALAAAGCREDRAASPAPTGRAAGLVWFEEVAAASGIDFVHTSGHRQRYWFPEIVSGGVGVCDFDGDGFMDLYFVQGRPLDPDAAGPAPSNRLYRNRGDGSFEDITAAAGALGTGYGMGCACGDYDGDGDADLYVTNVGPDVLYRNEGDGTFSDVTAAAGVGDPSWGSSTAFVDYDQDGDLDLFVANYINWAQSRELACATGGGVPDYCQPNNYNAPAPDTLYRNNGDGTFTEVSEAAGLRAAFGNGLGVATGDFNDDGRPDIYVANDSMKNQLWINHGDGTFTDEALLSGCAVNIHGVAAAGMGVAAVDLEDDGDLDLFITHLRGETHTLYVNNASIFEDATARAGLAASSQPYTGFGTGFADFDHDGRLDLYVANGRVMLHSPPPRPDDPYAEPNQLFRGVGGGRFEEVLPRGGTAELLVHASRAAALGDLDNDGDLDIVVVNRDAAPYVLRNVIGQPGRWVMFRVLGRNGADAIGAELWITAGGIRRRHVLQPAHGYCSSSDPRVHFGLGQAAQVDRVTVRWPTGEQENFGPLPAGRLHVLRAGTGK